MSQHAEMGSGPTTPPIACSAARLDACAPTDNGGGRGCGASWSNYAKRKSMS